MEIVRHADVDAFHEVAGSLIEADPVRHTTVLTSLAAARAGRTSLTAMVTAHDGGRVVGAAVQVAGFALVVATLPTAAARPVAAALHGGDMPAVFGPTATAEAFAAAWTELSGGTARVSMRHRLYELTELTPPRVPGGPRVVTAADADLIDLVARWRLDFAEEAFGRWEPGPDPRELTMMNLRVGHGLVLWVDGGEPVALAIASAPTAGMSRVSSVWTPVALRGRGHGSAVTAACSRWALDAGARHVVLFTDLANPVSNAIYPRLGYRAVEDSTELRFDVAPPPPDAAQPPRSDTAPRPTP